MRFRLRTLLIVLALGPPLLVWAVPPVIAWIREPPTPMLEYGSRWNGPYELEPEDWETNSLDELAH